jgi:hypothetical protein
MRWTNLKHALAVAAVAAMGVGVLAAATPLSASAQALICEIVVQSQDACTAYCNEYHPGYAEAYWNPVDGCCACFF